MTDPSSLTPRDAALLREARLMSAGHRRLYRTGRRLAETLTGSHAELLREVVLGAGATDRDVRTKDLNVVPRLGRGTLSDLLDDLQDAGLIVQTRGTKRRRLAFRATSAGVDALLAFHEEAVHLMYDHGSGLEVAIARRLLGER